MSKLYQKGRNRSDIKRMLNTTPPYAFASYYFYLVAKSVAVAPPDALFCTCFISPIAKNKPVNNITHCPKRRNE